MKKKKRKPKVKAIEGSVSVAWFTLVNMKCPKCKRVVQVKMDEDKMGKELICKECMTKALAKVPRLKPVGGAIDKGWISSFQKKSAQ